MWPKWDFSIYTVRPRGVTEKTTSHFSARSSWNRMPIWYGFDQMMAIKKTLTSPISLHIGRGEFRISYPQQQVRLDNARSFYFWRHRKPFLQPHHLVTSGGTVLRCSYQPLIRSHRLFTPLQEVDPLPPLPAYAALVLAEKLGPSPPTKYDPSHIAMLDQIHVCTLKPAFFWAQADLSQRDGLCSLWSFKTFLTQIDLEKLSQSPTQSPRSSLTRDQFEYLLHTKFLHHLGHLPPQLWAWASIFTVAKMNLLRRPIINPFINQIFHPLLQLQLASPFQFLAKAFHNRYVITADQASWFCQIPLLAAERPFFALKIFNQLFTPSCMPQGFKPVPAFAQLLSEILVKPFASATVWVGNTFLFGVSFKGILEDWCSYLKRCALAGAQLKPSSSHHMAVCPKTSFTGVDYQVDLAVQRWRVDPVWALKVLPFVESCIYSEGFFGVLCFTHCQRPMEDVVFMPENPCPVHRRFHIGVRSPQLFWSVVLAILISASSLSGTLP